MEATPIYNELLRWPEYQELDYPRQIPPEPLENPPELLAGTQELTAEEWEPWQYNPASYESVTIFPIQQNPPEETMSRNHPLYEDTSYSPSGTDDIFYDEEPLNVIYTPSDYDTKSIPLVDEPVSSKQAQGSSIMEDLESISTRTTGNYLGTKQRRKSRGRNRR